MEFPEKVIFKIVDNKTKKPVANIAISLVLYAHKKNDYYVGPKISDNEGLITFEKKDCIKEINNSKEFYLMDYSSSLEECLPRVAIRVKPRKEIEFAVENIRRNRDIYQKYWDCSEDYLSALSSASNDEYIAKSYDFSELELKLGAILIVDLEKK